MEKNKYGKLHLVATPIGNLEDITFRAIETLKSVDIIVAEDTRHTLKLLNHFQITKPLISYHRHSSEERGQGILEKILLGENVALVSDAGTPGICDPGEELVKKAIEKGIEIIAIPGACAFINALIGSGLETNKFSFYGFLPKNHKTRKELLLEISEEDKTIIIYEAPHKLKETLKDLLEYLGNRRIVLARELTKIHEEYIRGKIEEIIKECKEPRGEYVIIIEKNKISKTQQKINNINEMTLEEHYKYYEEQGIAKKEIIKKIAKDRNVNKNEIYQKFI